MPPPQHQSHRIFLHTHPPSSPGMHQQGSRRAFQAVKDTIHGSNSHLSSSSSIEARKTGLNCRFHTRTPKSAHFSHLPRSKPFCFLKENALSDSVSNKLNRVKKSQSSKTSTSSEATAVCDPVIESHSVSGDL
ncbi:hypothetical protein V6N12_068796 [Hibiscus sabdariffa]|uniref:Uncharacterized protein n=1 Tax=Hibiscus sabdariffa TaxID=183260 RepID=A0ABR2B0Q0_9ROSI